MKVKELMDRLSEFGSQLEVVLVERNHPFTPYFKIGHIFGALTPNDGKPPSIMVHVEIDTSDWGYEVRDEIQKI